MRQSITSTISIEQFRSDWADYIPIAELCQVRHHQGSGDPAACRFGTCLPGWTSPGDT
jgi:hypothetical protein